MDLTAFQKLSTLQGQQALQAADELDPKEQDFLRHFTTLCRDYPDELARAALEIAILRREAESKFPVSGKMFFTRAALEQSSSSIISEYRAKRFVGTSRILDMGCSIGGDTLSLAKIAPTIGIDLDPRRLMLARANMLALGLDDVTSFVRADLRQTLPMDLMKSTGLGVFFDPARRKSGRRLFSVRDYIPPLNQVNDWSPYVNSIGVKISPGVNLDELNPYDAEIEFISLKRELKEAVLWFGPLKTTRRRATLLPGEHTLVESSVASSGRFPLSEPDDVLYEPDPAVLRAGLVRQLGEQLNASQLDPDIAYLTADQYVETPFARAWGVDTWMPFSIKRLRIALRQRNVGRVVVKKRGSPLQPEELIRALRLKWDLDSSNQERVLFLTHLRGNPIIVICFPNLLHT